MPYTFVEIEEHKTRSLLLLFGCLVVLYTTTTLLLFVGGKVILGLGELRLVRDSVTALAIGLVLAWAHWMLSTHRLLERVLAAVLAGPLDPKDTYHQQLRRIVEEVSVATGSRYRIEPYVISTSAANACSILDFDGRAAIAVTEGLLARLNRAQLEAVVGHEAAHIVRGDSLARTVLCGLFGLYEEALRRLIRMWESDEASGVRVGGRAAVFLLFATAVLAVTEQLKRFCELAISREQEYRADAVAVRLTRNSLSLAEALHEVDRHWRGVGGWGDQLDTLFIVDPGSDALAEREGLGAEMFATHPPTERRIEALLGMAQVPPSEFERAIIQRRRRPRTMAPVSATAAGSGSLAARWRVWRDATWLGPLALDALTARGDLAPDTWVMREGEAWARPASEDPELRAALERRYAAADGAKGPSRYECPSCRLSLIEMLYEGVPLRRCPACGGCYVASEQLTRVFVREEYDFPESVRRLAASMSSLRGGDRQRVMAAFARQRAALKDRRCPDCGAAVLRQFYTVAYLVEVEKCFGCGLAWLDRGELELLQYLYETRAAQGLEG